MSLDVVLVNLKTAQGRTLAYQGKSFGQVWVVLRLFDHLEDLVVRKRRIRFCLTMRRCRSLVWQLSSRLGWDKLSTALDMFTAGR